MARMITDRGKPTQITWQQDAAQVQVLPSSVPRANSGATRIGPMQPLPAVPGVTDDPDLPGSFQADWFLSASDGLTVTGVRYIQTAASPPTLEAHAVVEFMQWRHLRLIIDRGPTPFPVLLVPLPDTSCSEAFLITLPGVRADGKVFAWAAGASFGPIHVPDPGTPATIYTVVVSQAFLFGAPAADIEPSKSAVAVKVYPVLTVTVESSDPIGFPPPSFAADLRLLFAPRLTRDDQHRPAAQFPDTGRRGTNVVNMFCDANDLTRGIPGGFTKPTWDVVFDYGEPDLSNETEFDAVVFPRAQVQTNPYTLTGPVTSQLKILPCQRVGGQGEFDNIHIHPWVGFDDPSDAANTGQTNIALIEAPLAADEVIHLHWRWGVPIPVAAATNTHLTPTDRDTLARSFRGYSAQGDANVLDGGPLIPPSQSLRVKIAHPQHDVADATGGPLDPTQTVVWYSPTFHVPANHGYTQFCGHGFSLAYRLKDLPTPFFLPDQHNADLLDAPSLLLSYHELRWNSGGAQRVPTASSLPGLSRNRLGTGSPPVDQPNFTFPPQLRISLFDPLARPMSLAPFLITLSGGEQRSGVADATGLAILGSVQDGGPCTVQWRRRPEDYPVDLPPLGPNDFEYSRTIALVLDPNPATATAERLRNLGYFGGAFLADDVESFQRDHGLAVTGDPNDTAFQNELVAEHDGEQPIRPQPQFIPGPLPEE